MTYLAANLSSSDNRHGALGKDNLLLDQALDSPLRGSLLAARSSIDVHRPFELRFLNVHFTRARSRISLASGVCAVHYRQRFGYRRNLALEEVVADQECCLFLMFLNIDVFGRFDELS
jgi:hypothetical protein